MTVVSKHCILMGEETSKPTKDFDTATAKRVDRMQTMQTALGGLVMGVSYLVFTLDQITDGTKEDDKTAEWMKEHNLALPSPLPQSRFPTLRELKAVAGSLDGYVAQVRSSSSTNSVDIDVSEDEGWGGTTIWTKRLGDKSRPPEDEDTVQPYFHKGDPAIAVRVVERLTQICGPLVLMRDFDAKPLLVTEGLDQVQALNEW